jgi:hypothetical protein
MTFHSVGNVIIPSDELIFFRWVGIPPTLLMIEPEPEPPSLAFLGHVMPLVFACKGEWHTTIRYAYASVYYIPVMFVGLYSP